MYGTREKVLVSLDANGDGKISLDELRTKLIPYAESEHHAGLDEMLGGIDLARVFNILDYDFSGELSLAELMDCDPRKEAAIRDDCINRLRRSLISFFGTPENIMQRLDANMNGKLSYGEFKDGLDRCHFDYKSVLKDKSLLWVFKVMDVNNTGDLPIHDLLEANSSWLQMKAAEARRQRLMRRKMRAKTGKRKAVEDDVEAIPSCDMGELTPALKMIADFNLQGAEGDPSSKGSKSGSSDGTKKLDMSHRYIGEKGALFLANSLLEPRFAQMKTLELRANYIGVKASMWIAMACEKLTGLRNLGLSWNHIDDHAAPRLAQALATIKTLKELDLSFNRIRFDGAETFSKALKQKGLKLEILDLRFNAIDKRGVTRLRAAARKVVEVRLDGNPGNDALNESPLLAPRLTGGEVLPKILDVVVTGWPRESTSQGADGPKNKKGSANHAARSSPVYEAFSSQHWPAAKRLERNLSEAALTAVGTRRLWSRNAVRRHSPLAQDYSF
jgi:Ca2+-binding EF-hand superfamily protein